VTDINWIEDVPAEPVEVDVRVRYRHAAVRAVLTPEHRGRHAHIRFLSPQSAVTPGQGAVWYRGEILWGGGFIETVQASCTT
jgi:tRNA-specific 2-thiouridylase